MEYSDVWPSGTNQADLATFDVMFAAQLQPQLSILGFYMNDFRDNLDTD